MSTEVYSSYISLEITLWEHRDLTWTWFSSLNDFYDEIFTYSFTVNRIGSNLSASISWTHVHFAYAFVLACNIDYYASVMLQI